MPVKALTNQEVPKRLLMLQKSVTLVLEGTHCTVISSSETGRWQFKKRRPIFEHPNNCFSSSCFARALE